MTNLLKRLAHIGVCVALALPMVPATVNAQPARTVSTGGPEQLYHASTGGKAGSASLKCLTEALYFEARGEGSQGQRAVAEVILNRVDHPRFPKSVCGVVNQSGQFTYKKTRIRERGAFARAQQIAKAALMGAPRNLTNGATYFHTGGVRPSWSKRFERTTRIGSHIFYRSDRRLASN